METTELINEHVQTASKRLIVSFLLWVLMIDICYYEESFGLNTLLVTVLSAPLFLVAYPENLRKTNWWIALTIWFFTAIGVFVNGSFLGIFFYLMAFMYFITINRNDKLTVVNALIQSIPIVILGIISMFFNTGEYFNSSRGKHNKWLKNLLMFAFPLLVIIIFLKLYQSADQNFYELTKFINLDFISWGFLFFFIILCVILFGYFASEKFEEIDNFELKRSNNILITYRDKIQDFLGAENEAKVARIILISLNLMLILYNVLDFEFIALDMHDPASDKTLSEVVHAGIYALITSIVLVMLIVTYILRGQLNFTQNKWIKQLILIWLAQNIIMIITTSIKNLEYVHFWGLTHKRIGVFVYLFLALIGICFTIHKTIHKKSFWFLFRKTSVAFALVLSALLTFNWNRAIAAYNTSYVPTERIDFDYLYELGPETYAFILDHHIKHDSVENYMLINIANTSTNFLNDYKTHEKKTSWKSYVLTDLMVKAELEHYNIIIPDKYKYNYEDERTIPDQD